MPTESDNVFTCELCHTETGIENKVEVINRTGHSMSICQGCFDQHGYLCNYCEENQVVTDGENHHYNVNGSFWCPSCVSASAFYCDRCGQYFHSDDCNNMAGDESWCSECFDEYARECSSCETWVHCDDMSTLTGLGGELDLCSYCQEENYAYDEIAEYWFPLRGEGDEVVYLGTGPYASVISYQTYQYLKEKNLILYDINENPLYKWHRLSWIKDEEGRYQSTGTAQLDDYEREFDTAKEKALMFLETANMEGWPIGETYFTKLKSNGVIPRTSVYEPHWSLSFLRTFVTDNNSSSLPRQKRRKNKNDLINSLQNKSKSDLSCRQQPAIAPKHDKLYTGMEIECYGGSFLSNMPTRLLSQELPDCKVVHDGSIIGNNGNEFLPPVVKTEKDWSRIKDILNTLKAFGWMVNQTCGLHFHMSKAELSQENPDIIRRLIRMFYFLEPFIFLCLPKERRRNEYCYPLAKFFTKDEIMKNTKLDYWFYGSLWKKKVQRDRGFGNLDYTSEQLNRYMSVVPLPGTNHRATPMMEHPGDEELKRQRFGEGKFTAKIMEINKDEKYYVGRYMGLNLHALFEKGTVEFRYLPSSLNYGYVRFWHSIFETLVNNAITGKGHETIEAATNLKGSMEKILPQVFKAAGLNSEQVKGLTSEFKKYKIKAPAEENKELSSPESLVNAFQLYEARLNNTRPRPYSWSMPAYYSETVNTGIFEEASRILRELHPEGRNE